MSEKENVLLTRKNILICLTNQTDLFDIRYRKEFNYISDNFCGVVASGPEVSPSPHGILYLCGDIGTIQLEADKHVNIIKELSYNYENLSINYSLIRIGEVPINIYNVGIYFRDLFSSDNDYFNLINNEHQFQDLTESNKPTNAYRKGIYLTKVEEDSSEEDSSEEDSSEEDYSEEDSSEEDSSEEDSNEEDSSKALKFKLLRCSSNFDGPTDNFHAIDNTIINQVNNVAEHYFEEGADLNHVLAQIYENTHFGGKNGDLERKAKISEHSDKTKDMPRNGLIAFCTFYKNYSNGQFNDSNGQFNDSNGQFNDSNGQFNDSNGQFNDSELNHIEKSKDDAYDYCVKGTSILTKIRFRLKKPEADLKKIFDVVLYPNSAFIIPLSTNRLYTHEIIPSVLPIDKIPIRMGYVIRCSKTSAIFKDNQTYINDGDRLVKLEEPTQENIKDLKTMYSKENSSTEMIHYDKLYFSLNKGDYKRPIMTS
jgi:hypothetical protein